MELNIIMKKSLNKPLKQLNISSLSELEYKDAVEKIYMEVYYPEERI